MALKNNFYEEIFSKEQEWIKLINNNLLNSVYCNLELKPFYVQKKQELLQEYNSANTIIVQILSVIDSIIEKINTFDQEYRNFQMVDIKSLLPLFLTNQMSNTSQKKSSGSEDINDLKIKKQILQQLINDYNEKQRNNDVDYLEDDSYVEHRKVI